MEDQLERLFNAFRESVLQYFDENDRSEVKHHFKDNSEVATRFDNEIEAIIIDKIAGEFPGHKIVSEERGITGSGSYVWYIDPVDNTVGLVSGERDISTSISLKHGEDHIRSMVINPRTGEVYEAGPSGSFKNGNSLNGCSGSLYSGVRGVSTCAYVGSGNIERIQQILGRLFEKRIPLRISGGSALDLCYVAEGRSVAHVSLGAHTWDVEAGIHLVREAGGVVEVLARYPRKNALALVAAANRAALEELGELMGELINLGGR